MWSGKMATRWRRKDGHLKPGKGTFLSCNNPDEFVLNTEVNMDTHATVDHSILAIFEDSSALSEDKAGAEEDNDKLLSALTKMLESVEDDDDTLSPFNTLPEASLLMSQDTIKENSVSGICEAQKPSWDEEIILTGALSHPNNDKLDAEVEVFTSASLVNLVKIMHPYCLKLQVEEEPAMPVKNSTLFSNEEVWKYERPTEDVDEEINVVSDDDEPMDEETKAQDNSIKPLKSALLNGSQKKEKKRVSFGTVRVASFDINIASVADNTIPEATANDAALDGAVFSENDKTINVQPQKPEGKRKPISLQQYRQLRQKRQPLVEKQGNYTTKWPLVTVPPKELTPILHVHGQKQTRIKPVSTQDSVGCFSGTKTSSNVKPLKTKASGDAPHKVKHPKINFKVQPSSFPNVPLPVCTKSPTKKATIVSSDPPNPVLVPMPVQHTSPTEHALNQNEKSSLQFTEEASTGNSTHSPKCSNQNPNAVEEKRLPNSLDLTKQSSIAPVNSPLSYEPPTPVTTPVKDVIPEAAFSISPSRSPPATSGIEASDLTSLLKQFEETQAIEEGESVKAPQINSKLFTKLDCAAPNSILQMNPVSSPHSAFPMALAKEPVCTSALNCGPNLKIPEPLGTEVILRSTQDQPLRRKGPPAKAIQIIDPRPLPFKRTYQNVQEPAYSLAHVSFAISSDHNYCTVFEGNQTPKKITSEPPEFKQTNPSTNVSRSKQASEVETLENSSNKSTGHGEITKTPTANPKIITDSAKKTNSSHIPADAYAIPPTPPPSPPYRGGDGTSPPPRGRDGERGRKRYRRRSRSSDSSSSSDSCSSSASSSSSSSRSVSRSPKRQRRHRHSSESSSCLSSPSRSHSPLSPRRHNLRPRLSRSRSSSWSRSRSRSRSHSPLWRVTRRRGTDVCSRESRKLRREQEIRAQKLRAIDERRVVYVGRIRRSMTHEELRERFSQFGEVESVSLHFRDKGDHYGFVTFYNMDDAFAAIDNGGKLRRHDELPFDICFGGRRQFCNSHYADLDANRDAERSPVRSRYEEVDFDLLLKQAQKGLKR